MDIVFNIDNGYVSHMCVTMLSILEHNRDVDVHFHVMTYSLSQDNREYVTALIKKRGGDVSIYDIDLALFRGFPIGKGTANPSLSYATYLRLLIVDSLPATVKKVLYLDCDIVVVNSLKGLWNLDISNFYLAAMSDWGPCGAAGMERLGIEDKYNYFNAGVLLLNMVKLREFNLFEKAKD